MSSKSACYTHGAEWGRLKLFRRVFASIGGLILLAMVFVLLALRPAKPSFYLRGVVLSQFNLTSASSSLTATAQVTLSSHNPDDRLGVHYDRMDVYAVYKGQQVTVPTALPRAYLGPNDTTVWSPDLFGASVTLAQPLADSLAQDMGAGALLLDVRVAGRLRWKVGSWVCWKSDIHVNCPAFLTNAAADGYKLHQGTAVCSVDFS